MTSRSLESTLRQYECYQEGSASLLESFVEYAELCTDPLEVFRYMEKKNICTNMSAYWIEKTKVYCKMGEYSKAVDELIAAQQKAITSCPNKQDYSKFMTETDTHLYFIEEQIENAIRRKTRQKRSIELYESLDNQQQKVQSKQSQRVSSNRSIRQKIKHVLEIFQKECAQQKSSIKQKFQTGQKNKPRCSLSNDLQKSTGPKLHRTHSILHKPSFAPVSSQDQQGSPSRQKPKLFRKETMDSVEIMRRKKQIVFTEVKKDESLLPEDSRMYRSTSVLEGKKVHFGSASNAKGKQTAGPKLQKFKSINLSYLGDRSTEGVNLREEFEKQKKEQQQQKSIEKQISKEQIEEKQSSGSVQQLDK